MIRFTNENGADVGKFTVANPKRLGMGMVSGVSYPGEVFVTENCGELKKIRVIDTESQEPLPYLTPNDFEIFLRVPCEAK